MLYNSLTPPDFCHLHGNPWNNTVISVAEQAWQEFPSTLKAALLTVDESVWLCRRRRRQINLANFSTTYIIWTEMRTRMSLCSWNSQHSTRATVPHRQDIDSIQSCSGFTLKGYMLNSSSGVLFLFLSLKTGPSVWNCSSCTVWVWLIFASDQYHASRRCYYAMWRAGKDSHSLCS